MFIITNEQLKSIGMNIDQYLEKRGGCANHYGEDKWLVFENAMESRAFVNSHWRENILD